MSRWYSYKSLVRGRGGPFAISISDPPKKSDESILLLAKPGNGKGKILSITFFVITKISRSWNKKRNVMLHQIRRQQKWTSCETIAHHLIVIKCDYLYLINVKTYLHTEKLYRYLFAHTSNWIVIKNIISRPQARGSRIGRPIIKAQSSLSVHNEDLGAVNIRCVDLFI